MAQRRPRFYQRTYLIDKSFQLRYVGSVLLLSTVITMLLGYFVYDKAREATEIMNITNPELAEMVAWADAKLLIYLGLFVLVQALSVTFVGVMMTHRIAGPVFRLRRNLSDLASGHLKEVGQLRKRDELQALIEPMNDLVNALREEAERDRDVLDAAVKQLEATGADGLKEVTAKLADHRDRKIRHLDSAPPTDGHTVENPPAQAPPAAAPAAEEKPAEEKPAEEKPAEEAPASEEKPAEEKPADEKPAEEKPADEKPASEEKPAEEAPAEEATKTAAEGDGGEG